MGIDYKTLKAIAPFGRETALPFFGMAAGAAVINPLTPALVDSALTSAGIDAPTSLSQIATIGLGLGIALASASKYSKRILEVADTPPTLISDVKINPSNQLPSKETIRSWNGVCLGYRIHDAKPIIVDWDNWMRHCFIIGQSGTGKTVFAEWLMFQQIVHGGGLIFIDGKLDEANLRKIFTMATYAGRRSDVIVINPGNPRLSNSYNPILYGDADEVAARILSLIPSTETNPGADHYRQSANQALVTLIQGIQSIPVNSNIKNVKGMAYNFLDLSILLQNSKAMLELEKKIPPMTDGGRQFRIWLDQFKISKDGEIVLDLKKMRDLFGGVAGRLHTFGTGNFGEITSTYSPEANLFDAIVGQKIVYVALPTMGKAEAASNFGKMLVGDYRTAVSWIQGLRKEQRPWPPTLAIFDEAGSYVNQAWARIFEQARSAHQALVPAAQTTANFEAISAELADMIIGNTWTKVVFKLGENNTIDRMVKIFGTEKCYQETLSFSVSGGESASTSGSASSSSNQGINEGLREAEVERIKPTTITRLGKGEALVLYAGSDIHHIRVPMVEFDPGFEREAGTPDINRPLRRQFVQGLDLYRRANELLLQ